MDNTVDISVPEDVEHIRFAARDQLALVATARPGPGRPVLLAHGFGQTRQSWAGTQDRLVRAGHPSLAWDMRGHGESGRNPPGQAYASGQFVADQQLAAGLLGGAPVLVGASMGGLTGLLAQAARPCFSAMVLVDVTPRWEAAGAQRIHDFMTAFPAGFDSFEHAAQVIADYLPQRRARKTPAQLSHLLKSGRDQRLRWHWDPRLLSEFMADSHHLQETIAEAAAGIDIPVLLISGGRSDLVSDATVAHFLELVPRAQHVRLPEATHMLAGDDNDGFSETLLAFLRAQFPATGSTPAPALASVAGTGADIFESSIPGVPR